MKVALRAVTARGGFSCKEQALEKELQAVTGAFKGRCSVQCDCREQMCRVWLTVVARVGGPSRDQRRAIERSKRGESARNENSWRVESKRVDEYSLGKERHGTIARQKESMVRAEGRVAGVRCGTTAARAWKTELSWV
jgi:hypothetical protein